MSVKPILFNTEMVRAILDGRKSCTRRIVNPQWEECPHCKYVHNEYIYDKLAENIYCTRCGYPLVPERRAPYQPGDILYVRETVWQKIGYYLDIDGKPETGWNYSWAKRPSLHMPKEAARIWLKVTDVRVEQLQEITPQGAWKEGARCSCLHPVPDCAGNKTTFVNIWNSTIKKADLDCYGWDANPWVWVIEFERCNKPKEEN